MLDWPALKNRANEDAEFRIHARLWNATLRIGVGQRNTRLDIRDGEVASAAPWSGGMASHLAIQAEEGEWEQLLAATPRPFYQDLYPAAIHHGFTVVGDHANYCAYYPAVRRLIEIMREMRNA